MNTFNSFLNVFQLPALQAATWGLLSTFLFCVFIVSTKKWHGKLTMDFTDGVQKFHTSPTPRIGGIPIVIGLAVACGKAPQEVQHMLTTILFAGMPAFIFGVAEDITKQVGVVHRLIATMVSGLLAWWITDYSISRVDICGVDFVMKFTILSVIFTVFAVGGVANAINIIDGFNGLASAMSALAFIGYGTMAWQLGDNNLAGLSLILAACILGFFCVNWPLGKIFLGDGGAYFVGFALAWVAVMLIDRNPSVSVFAVLLVCAHPVIEVLFSIFRRRMKKLHPGHPDRLHFHSLVKQRYVRRWFSGFSYRLRNSITGVLMSSITLISIILANLIYENIGMSFIAVLTLCLGYVTIYARMVRFIWYSPISFLLRKSS
jgi:UDP-N-acetylmuramyl pentapeptide phosphotransferase/UDP-N-acetylglucosamine-1-phosphate transferase